MKNINISKRRYYER